MPYFSRLTDIVTCRLSVMLASETDPQQALPEIIREMEEGLQGALRSVRTSVENVARLEGEIAEQRESAANWRKQAKQALGSGQEDQARLALLRKREVEDLIAGLEQQLNAAIATQTHLKTILHALEARLADARRRLAEMTLGVAAGGNDPSEPSADWKVAPGSRSMRDLESELDVLRQELDSEE
jgi:phage shock protein A